MRIKFLNLNNPFHARSRLQINITLLLPLSDLNTISPAQCCVVDSLRFLLSRSSMARLCVGENNHSSIWILLLLIAIASCGSTAFAARSEKEIRERFYGNLVNTTAPENGEGSIAKMFDRVLEKEFSENDQPEGLEFLLFMSPTFVHNSYSSCYILFFTGIDFYFYFW